MSTPKQTQKSSGIDIHDALYALYRRKWIVVGCALLGLVSAAVYYVFAPRDYVSVASLLVKYLVDRSAVDAVDSQTEVYGRYSNSLMNTETVLLTSRDLAVEAAEAYGPDRLLAGMDGEKTVNRAAAVIRKGLAVETSRGSNVINVSFRSRDPELPQPVLKELIQCYFDKHLEVHRSLQAFDFVSQQKDLVRARINDLDNKIDALKKQAGISSFADTPTDLHSQIIRIREELLSAEAELEGRMVRARFISQSVASANKDQEDQAEASIPDVSVPPDAVQQYRVLVNQLALYRENEAQLLSRYTEQTSEVRSVRARIRSIESRKSDLEESYPGLLSVATSTSPQGAPVDTLTEQAMVEATKARVAALRKQLAETEEAAERMSAVSSELEDLEIQRAAERKNYADFQMKLEKSRIDEALDPAKIPNISALQTPSPAFPLAGKRAKIALGIAGGGVALGLGIVLAFGLLFDPSIKRPMELESGMLLPSMVPIPRVTVKGRKVRAEGANSKSKALVSLSEPEKGQLAPWQQGHFIRPYAESIRDRIILDFELRDLLHKPKLIGVTGLSGGEGTSTVAGGLAASLSETGDGKVLLVDMNGDNPEMKPFFDGSADRSLLQALETNDHLPSAGENLYLAKGESGVPGSLRIAPKRFYELMPVLRASDFDYIIFDLPPLQKSGATLALSGSMDKVLLMVEMEKSERNKLKRASSELVAAKANVAVVPNKFRDDVPAWILG